jgi:agmatinase
VTIDVDGLDLPTRELFGILRGLAGCDLVGMDVVEISPPLDHADLKD